MSGTRYTFDGYTDGWIAIVDNTTETIIAHARNLSVASEITYLLNAGENYRQQVNELRSRPLRRDAAATKPPQEASPTAKRSKR